MLTYKKYKKETNDPVLFITTHHWKPSSVVWLFFFSFYYIIICTHTFFLLFNQKKTSIFRMWQLQQNKTQAHTYTHKSDTKEFKNMKFFEKQATCTCIQKWKKKTLFHLLIWFMSFHLPFHMVFGVWTKSVRMKMYEIMWKHIFLPFCQSYFRAIIKCWVKLCMYA